MRTSQKSILTTKTRTPDHRSFFVWEYVRWCSSGSWQVWRRSGTANVPHLNTKLTKIGGNIHFQPVAGSLVCLMTCEMAWSLYLRSFALPPTHSDFALFRKCWINSKVFWQCGETGGLGRFCYVDWCRNQFQNKVWRSIYNNLGVWKHFLPLTNVFETNHSTSLRQSPSIWSGVST